MNKCTCYCAKCGRTFEIPWLAHEWDTDKYHDCKPRTVYGFQRVPPEKITVIHYKDILKNLTTNVSYE